MQNDTETISEYTAALQKLANTCQFKTNTNDQILDQLIVGLKSKSIKAELLKMEEPKLTTALKKALRSEAAEKGVEKLQK